MKISWNHLSELVDLKNISVEDIANKLTLAGLEVENIEYADTIKDTILDIYIAANRQDITGWAQIAVEVSAIAEQSLSIKSQANNIKLKHLEDGRNQGTHRAYALYVNRQALTCSDKHLLDLLSILGINSSNSILDIVNFINLKWGQSIRAYKLMPEQFTEIKNLNIEIKQKISSIESNTVRGYINNQELQHITEANLDKNKKTSGVLLINYQHERQVNRSYCINAYSEIVSLTKPKIKSAEVASEVYCHFQDIKDENWIKCATEEIGKVLGPATINDQHNKKSLNSDIIARITTSLGLYTEYKSNDLNIKIPSIRRKDLKSAIDITEEVARIYGFDKFYDNLPKFKRNNKKLEKTCAKQKIRNILRSMGLHEAINYSFNLRNERNCGIHIVNALNQEQETLRTNIIGGLINIKKYNQNQSNINLEAFEIGNVFIKEPCEKKYKESTRLAYVLGNNTFNKSNWQTRNTPLTWLQAKGHAEELFERIDAQIFWSNEMSSNGLIESLKQYIHPTKRIYIICNNEAIGVLSQVNYRDILADSISYFTEINLSKLMQAIRLKNHLRYIYNPYSSYPKVNRDFSITISVDVSMKQIQNTLKSIQGKESSVIESVYILSEYYNNRHKKTLCLRATYRSKKKTLTSKEVEILDNMLKLKLSTYSRARHKPGSVLNNSNQG